MAYSFTPYAIAQFLTAAVSIIVAVNIWQRRTSRGGWPLFILFEVVSEWALANGMEAAAVPVDQKVFWAKVTYLGSQISPLMIVLFALQYTGRSKRVSPRSIAFLLIIPLAALILVATNEFHGLIWKQFLPCPPGTNSLIYVHGSMYWVVLAYIACMVIAGTLLLFFSAVRSQLVYQKQNRFILIGSVMPLIGLVMYVFNLNPFPGLDTASISFMFTGLLLVWGMRYGGLMDIVPIAHELIIENVDEGILVVDDRYRVIDLNTAADAILKLNQTEIMGFPLETSGSFWKRVQSCFDR